MTRLKFCMKIFQEYDHERTSVSDEKNKAFLKFLHTLDRCDTELDEHVQPGGDLTSYLRDLKSSARLEQNLG